MTNFQTFIDNITQYLPIVMAIIMVLAIVLMIGVIILTNRSVKKAALKRAPQAPTATSAANDQKSNISTKLPPLGGFITDYLSRKGVFKVSDLSLSFLRAVEFLKQSLKGRNYRYHLSWYMLIGTSDSGKSTMMQQGLFNHPVGHHLFGISGAKPPCQWWFLNRGIVLDIRGDYLLSPVGTNSDEVSWRSLMTLLTRYRPARPLDGIILAIPATEIYGKDKLSMDDIYGRARLISNKLQSLQYGLGVQLPVYVVLTKSDVIKGFSTFIKEIPGDKRMNMLGWSSPYSLDTAYAGHWAEDAIQSITSDIDSITLEIFSETKSGESIEDLLLFAGEIEKIRSPLKIYLDALFKGSAYQESLLLRGVYLTGEGEQGNIPLFVDKKDEKDAKLSPTSKEPLKICFVNDLLSQKVFQEVGLAKPIHSRLLTANRALNIAKISTATFVLVGTFGVMNSYEHFSKHRDYLLPVLSRINTVLHQLQTVRSAESTATILMFDDHAKNLLDMMHQVYKTDFFSVFFPSSWFSPLESNLNYTIKIAYDQIILRTIYLDLVLKGKKLFELRPSAMDQSKSISDLLLPTNSPEFQLVDGYVKSLAQVIQFSDKFNQLKDSLDSKTLDELVEFTFGSHLPEEFSTHFNYFRSILRDVNYPKINVMHYKSFAQETLVELYRNFAKAILSTTDQNSILGRLKFITTYYSQQVDEKLPDINFLREFSKDLTKISPLLGNAGETWIDGPFFNPKAQGEHVGEDFSQLIAQIHDMPIFGKEIVELLASDTAFLFGKFREELNHLNTLFVDQKLVPTDQTIHPSQGLIQLSKSLAGFFAEPFMAKPIGSMFVTNVPPGKVVFWDSKLIQNAVDLTNRYDEYLNKSLSTLPPIFHEVLKLLASNNLQENVVGYIARAQSFIDTPTQATTGVAAEEIIRSKIADVREVSMKFVKLLEVLQKDSIGYAFVELRNLLGTLAYRLLKNIDDGLAAYTPYKVKEGNFSWWDGQRPSAYDGFLVKDIADLQVYLQKQVDLVKHWANEFAKPLVQSLSSEPMKGYQGDALLLNKWQRILEQLDLFEKNKPDSSILKLHAFIKDNMNSLTLKNIFKEVKPKDVRQSSGDFFVSSLIQLKKGLLAQAETLKRHMSIQAYQQLAEVFNQTLKEKYPFAGPNAKPGSLEADPDDIKRFFKLFKALGGKAIEVLDQIYQIPNIADDNLQFLQQMEKVGKFFDSYLVDNPSDNQPFFNYQINFRVNRDEEVGGANIIDYYIQVGDNRIDHKQKIRTGVWNFGDPIEVGFRWPEEFPEHPIKDDKQTNQFLEDNDTIVYQYTGNWSLLWYFTLQKDRPFEIPVTSGKKTIVKNEIRLTTPPKGKKLPQPLTIPDFPIQAPEISKEVLDIQEMPVIVDGDFEVIDQKDEEGLEEGEEAKKAPQKEKEAPKKAAEVANEQPAPAPPNP